METGAENKEIGYNSVQEFIEAMNKKQKQEEENIKNEILIHFGLIDKEKSEREYFPYFVNDKCKWDEDLGKYYIEKPVPLEVSDEEYNEILKLAEAEVEFEFEEEKPKKSSNWGNAIEVIAWITLILNILSIFIFIFMFNEISWVAILYIIGIIPSFCLLMGFAKLVSAAEKYLRK